MLVRLQTNPAMMENYRRRKTSLALSLVILAAALHLPTCYAAQCNLCGKSGLACVSQTEFQVCTNGSPTGAITSCPTGYICSTVSKTICNLNTGNVVGDCSRCNVCDETNTYACTGPQTFALCLGTATPSTTAVGTCQSGQVCNVDYPQICGTGALGVVATCPTSGEVTTTTTTTSLIDPVNNPQLYCQQQQRNARFVVGRALSTTCRQYVLCFLRNGIWSGQLYTCPGRTYFFSTSLLCQDDVPPDCV